MLGTIPQAGNIWRLGNLGTPAFLFLPWESVQTLARVPSRTPYTLDLTCLSFCIISKPTTVRARPGAGGVFSKKRKQHQGSRQNPLNKQDRATSSLGPPLKQSVALSASQAPLKSGCSLGWSPKCRA